MKKNCIFFILGAFLLIEQCLGETENISPSKKFTSSANAFRDAAIAKLGNLSEEPIKLGTKLLEDAYADKLNKENVTRLLAQSLRELERIDLDKPASRIKAFLSFVVVFDVVSGRVSISNEEKLSTDVLLAFKEALEKRDYISVANEFQQKFDEFLEWLTQELQAKSDKLTSEEQMRVKAFKKVCLDIRNETNLAKKMNALDDLINKFRL